jgi:hypothetical protein
MTFSILRYLEDLERRLAAMNAPKRLAFAAWCTEALARQFLVYLETKLGAEGASSLRSALDAIWETTIHGVPLDSPGLLLAKETCEDASWEESGEADDDITSYGATQFVEAMLLTIETAMSSSSKAAAHTAERVINQIDYELGMKAGVSDTFGQPLMKDELDRQTKMLAWLSGGDLREPTLRSLFRQVGVA